MLQSSVFLKKSLVYEPNLVIRRCEITSNSSNNFAYFYQTARFSNVGKHITKHLTFLNRFRPKCIQDFLFLAVLEKVCKCGLL